MNSTNVSKLFPAGTVIVAYKEKSLGGAKTMPQWKVEPLINENRYLRPSDEALADLKVENSISLEFDAIDPQFSESPHVFDDLPGGLTFLPLDPEKKVAYYFPLAKLQAEPEVKENYSINWKFEIFCDDNGVFMQKIKANG